MQCPPFAPRNLHHGSALVHKPHPSHSSHVIKSRIPSRSNTHLQYIPAGLRDQPSAEGVDAADSFEEGDVGVEVRSSLVVTGGDVGIGKGVVGGGSVGEGRVETDYVDAEGAEEEAGGDVDAFAAAGEGCSCFWAWARS